MLKKCIGYSSLKALFSPHSSSYINEIRELIENYIFVLIHFPSPSFSLKQGHSSLFSLFLKETVDRC